jgi:hypothetical protein
MNDRHLCVARRNLTSFVTDQAEATARRLGFGWRGSELAPHSFVELQREHRSSELTGLPLRVSTRFCDRTIYTSPDGNRAMRFWHDTSHVRLGLTFTPDDEMELGCYHLEVLRAHGFAADSLEHRLLHADTIGQTLCNVTIGRFPIDQWRFAEIATRLGVASAIEDVAGRELTCARSTRTSPDGEAA